MGDKLSAKKKVKEFGVPLVPGTDFATSDVGENHQNSRKNQISCDD